MGAIQMPPKSPCWVTNLRAPSLWVIELLFFPLSNVVCEVEAHNDLGIIPDCLSTLVIKAMSINQSWSYWPACLGAWDFPFSAFQARIQVRLHITWHLCGFLGLWTAVVMLVWQALELQNFPSNAYIASNLCRCFGSFFILGGVLFLN